MKAIYNPTGFASTYPSLLRALYNVNDLLKRDGIMAPSEDSLKNTRSLYERIGKPLDKIPTIHVGGTNGKGSTSFKVAEALRVSGLKTGLFVSPHLASFRERIQVNAELIPEASLLVHLPRVMTLCADMQIPATLFELTFITACLHYEASECDAVVLEVGLGGELDATNVISPALSVITSVSLDHTRVLGGTVEEIAHKKAGIFKHNKLALCGPGVPLAVLQAVATERGAHLRTLGDVVSTLSPDTHSAWDMELQQYSMSGSNVQTSSAQRNDGVVSDTDTLNAHISLAALALLHQSGGAFACLGNLGSPSLIAALRQRPSCRWEKFKLLVDTTSKTILKSTNTPLQSRTSSATDLPSLVKGTVSSSTGCTSSSSVNSANTTVTENDGLTLDSVTGAGVENKVEVEVVLDVGHNPAAMAALVARIREEYSDRNLRLLYAMSRDKDVRTCLRTALGAVKPNHIHFAQSKNFRAVPRTQLQQLFREETNAEVNDFIDADNVREMVRKVVLQAGTDGPNSVVVICGTGYIMPDARAEIGVIEPRDDEDLAREPLCDARR